MNAPGSLPLGLEAALGASLGWLRARLQRLAGGAAEVAGAAEPAEPPEPTEPPEHADPTPLAERVDAEPEWPQSLLALQECFGLSAFEGRLLLLCAAMEFDTRIPALCAAAQGDAARPYPSFALALALFDDASWDALSPHRPLRYWRLVELQTLPGQPLTAGALRADERIVHFLKGLNDLDERVAALLRPLEASGELVLPPSQQAAADALQRFVVQTVRDTPALVLQLTGADTAAKRVVAAQVAARFGLVLQRLALAALPAPGPELDGWCRLWRRESLLLPLALYLEGQPAAGDEAARTTLTQALDRLQGLVFVDTRDAAASGGAGSTGTRVVAVDKPSAAEQGEAWTQLLGRDRGALAARLAGQFNLGLPQIRAVAHAVGSDADDEALWAACRDAAHPRLGALAQRIDALAGWDDIVLPDEARELLRQIVAHASLRRRVLGDWGFERKTGRGLGLAALFHGESGTGKTMAAEVVARALKLDLYRIDLSSVVSKYIGETEKNLQRVFDAAEDGGSILFFDEADALFGKRSEVRDSHDRYANIETNYLLQRIEAYRGLAILATNMKGALDSAFLRRLRFVVPFAFPGPAERAQMWRKAFPAATPVDGLDSGRLGRLDCTGGSIHNIALNAAFLAAERGGPVTMPIVLDAARVELRKLGRPINEADFRLAPATGAS